MYISYWCVSVLSLFHLFGPRMTEHFLYFSFVREWHESSSHIPPFLVLYSTLQQPVLLRFILPFSYIIYKISSTNYLYIIHILFITINSQVLYSTLPQPTPLYIDPHRPVLSHALPREWVRGDLANGGWRLTFHNQAWKWEDTKYLQLQFYTFGFSFNCLV